MSGKDGIGRTFERAMGMLSFRISGMEIRVSIFAVLAVIFILMADFSEYTFLIFLAALVHEAAHICAMCIMGEKLNCISIYPFGADINVCAMLGYKEDFLISLSGPLINLLLFSAFIFSDEIHMNFFAVANLALALVNLIPAPGLDGGRMMISLLYLFFSFGQAQRYAGAVGAIGFMLLAAFAVSVLILSGGNFSAAFILVYLVLGIIARGKADI